MNQKLAAANDLFLFARWGWKMIFIFSTAMLNANISEESRCRVAGCPERSMYRKPNSTNFHHQEIERIPVEILLADPAWEYARILRMAPLWRGGSGGIFLAALRLGKFQSGGR